MDTTTTHQEPADQPVPPQLRRPLDDQMVAGVAAGIARYFDIDATIVRIGFVVLAFVGGAGLPIYLAGWLLIPEDGAAESIAAEFIHQPRSFASR
jgi:phage shock protein PspC (stress-responsive transcriptional regulator)